MSDCRHDGVWGWGAFGSAFSGHYGSVRWEQVAGTFCDSLAIAGHSVTRTCVHNNERLRISRLIMYLFICYGGIIILGMGISHR
jgi:hypothetical protein